MNVFFSVITHFDACPHFHIAISNSKTMQMNAYIKIVAHEIRYYMHIKDVIWLKSSSNITTIHVLKRVSFAWQREHSIRIYMKRYSWSNETRPISE